MDDDAALNITDCRVLLECLSYSKQRIREYSHLEYKHKLDSLQPLETVETKLRRIRDILNRKG